jgi:hypothetical protein
MVREERSRGCCRDASWNVVAALKAKGKRQKAKGKSRKRASSDTFAFCLLPFAFCLECSVDASVGAAAVLRGDASRLPPHAHEMAIGSPE